MQPDVVTRLVEASGQLTLDHLTHRRGVSLLPSTDVLTGASVDKLDNSTWLVQLLSLTIQMLQTSPVKKPDQTDRTPVEVAADSCHGKESGDAQGVTSNSSSSSGTSTASLSLTDKLVADKEIFLCLLECLNHCCADNQGVSSSTPSLSQEKISGKPTTVEDGVLQLLCVIQNQVGDLGVLVDGILAYLQPSKLDDFESSSASVKHLSEPLLWLFFKIFTSAQAVMQFYEKGEYLITLCLRKMLCSI